MKKFLLAAAAVAAVSSVSFAQDATNLWKDANPTKGEVYFAPGWAPNDNYTWELSAEEMTVTLKDATTDRWQAQFPVVTTLSTSADKAYEFSFDIEANNDFTALIKFQENADVYGILKDIPLTANTVKHFSGKFSGKAMTGIQAHFDFGGNPANTTVKITNFTLTETVIEDIQEPEGSNLWDASKATLGTVYFAPAWTPSTDYSAEINESGNLSASLTAATFERWQAQFPIHNTVDLVNGREYYFSCQVRTNNEFTCKVKLEEDIEGENKPFCMDEDIALENGVNTFKTTFTGKDMSNITLLYDFGTNPENTDILVRNIVIKDMDPSGVEGVYTTEDAAPEYFNLQGIRVANPGEGIYIVRRGNKVTKEIVRK